MNHTVRILLCLASFVQGYVCACSFSLLCSVLVYEYRLNSSTIDGYLCCFQFLTMNSASMNIAILAFCTHTAMYPHTQSHAFLLGTHLGVELVSHEIVMSICGSKGQTISKW